MPITIKAPPVRLVDCPGCHAQRARREEDSCVTIGSFWARYECGCSVRKVTCAGCGERLVIWNDDAYALICRSNPEECQWR